MSPEQRCWRWYFIIHWCTIMTIIFLIGVKHGWWWHRTGSSCSISREQGALLGRFLDINKGVLHLKGPWKTTIKLWHRRIGRPTEPPASVGFYLRSEMPSGNIFFFSNFFFGVDMVVSSKFPKKTQKDKFKWKHIEASLYAQEIWPIIWYPKIWWASWKNRISGFKYWPFCVQYLCWSFGVRRGGIVNKLTTWTTYNLWFGGTNGMDATGNTHFP